MGPMGDAVGSLRVRVLGGFAVDGLADAQLGSRKARTLLKVLALSRGAPVPIATIVDVLWPDGGPARPADQVAVLASRLRRVLGADRLVRSEAGLALVGATLDVDELHALVGEAAAALDEGRVGAARAAAGAALALARGPVLPDDDGAWVEVDRASASAATSRARGLAALAALRAGDVVGAELAAEAALAGDPYDEVSLRVLMQSQVAAGRPASALASYARTRERLAEDLGASPTAETEALHLAVLVGDGPSPVPAEAAVPLVGRERELAALEAHLARTSGGEARVVLVVGEAGIGKSALLQRLVEVARAGGCRVVTARADELGRDLPLQPLLDALGPALDGEEAAPVGPIGVPTTVPDTAGGLRQQFEAVLASLTSAGPAVVVLDDVHAADAATVEWLSWVRHRRAPLLVVAAGRPGVSVAGAHELVLGPLGAAAIGELVGPARGADLHERSGGNPLFALALAEAAEGSLPDSVHDAVATTVSRLEPPAVEVVRAGAVLGTVVDVDLLAGVLGLPALAVIDRLEQAASIGLVADGPAGFEFRHELARQAVASEVGVARASFWHRQAAEALSERTGADPLAVAVHAQLGGSTALAAGAFRRAAAVSLSRSDLVSAAAHLRSSLDAADDAGARVELARVLMVAGDLDAAAAEAERAIALDGGPDALEVAGWVAYYRRRYDQARRFADEAVARAATSTPVRASALALVGRVRHGTGDLAAAEACLSGALDGPPLVAGVAEVWLGQVRVHEGRPAEALDLLEHALLDPEHLAHPFAPLHGRFSRVLALGQLGRVGQALTACEDLRRAIERAGAAGTRFVATELNARSWLYRGIGRLGEAEDLNRDAIERNGAADGSGPSSDGFAEAYWVGWLDLVDGRLAAGDLDGAADLLAAIGAFDSWEGTMAWHHRHRVGLQRSRIALAGGDASRAAELAAAVAEDASARGSARYEALARAHHVLAAGGGDVDEVAGTVEVLRGCAALELPRLLEELGRCVGVEAWAREADDRRAALSSAR